MEPERERPSPGAVRAGQRRGSGGIRTRGAFRLARFQALRTPCSSVQGPSRPVPAQPHRTRLNTTERGRLQPRLQPTTTNGAESLGACQPTAPSHSPRRRTSGGQSVPGVDDRDLGRFDAALPARPLVARVGANNRPEEPAILAALEAVGYAHTSDVASLPCCAPVSGNSKHSSLTGLFAGLILGARAVTAHESVPELRRMDRCLSEGAV